MMSILATVDGSPESLAVIPALESLATNMRLHVRLLMIAERPKANRGVLRSHARLSAASPRRMVAGGRLAYAPKHADSLLLGASRICQGTSTRRQHKRA